MVADSTSHETARAYALHNANDFHEQHSIPGTAGKLKVEPPLTPNNGTSDGHDICVTHGCIRAALKVLDTIDETADPCKNFYEFACGTYLKNTFIPDDKVTIDLFSIVRDKVQDQLRIILNEDEQPNESKPFVLAKRLNKACLNKTIIEQRGIKPLADMLESFGGWPLVKGDVWSNETFNWLEMIKKFRKIGLDTSIIFSFAVTTDLKNSSARVLDVSAFISTQ